MKKEVMKAFSGIVEYYDSYMGKTEHTRAQMKVAKLLSEKHSGIVLDVATGNRHHD